MNLGCVFVILLLSEGAHSFQGSVSRPPSLMRRKSSFALSNAEDDDSSFPLTPETSFGADAVPEAQRPVNEYLDVTRQPLFGWASLESGSKGLLTRLTVAYSVLFAAV